MYVCKICGKEFEKKQSLGAHSISCRKKNNIKKEIKNYEKYLQPNGKCKCPYCKKEYSIIGIGSHIWRMHTEEGKEFKPFLGKSNPSSNRGKTNEEIYGKERAEEISLKISKKVTGRASTPEKEEERKRKISENGKGKIGGYREGSGRGKQGRYKGIWCDSSWELAWVIYNIDHAIEFERNKDKFEYRYKNKIKKYIPDFKLKDGTYIEIKGYETEQWKEKLKQFKEKIIVINAEEIKPFLNYVKNKYGYNFINLYEE
jgi:hypothetical protein